MNWGAAGPLAIYGGPPGGWSDMSGAAPFLFDWNAVAPGLSGAALTGTHAAPASTPWKGSVTLSAGRFSIHIADIISVPPGVVSHRTVRQRRAA